jgi:hypothetical protein
MFYVLLGNVVFFSVQKLIYKSLISPVYKQYISFHHGSLNCQDGLLILQSAQEAFSKNDFEGTVSRDGG